MTDPSIAATIASSLTPIAKKSGEKILAKLSEQVGQFAKAALDKTAVALRIGFLDYLNNSYEKCRFFKSILDP